MASLREVFAFLKPVADEKIISTKCTKSTKVMNISLKEEFMELYAVHSKEEKFRCGFYTLVIQNDALAKHYKGGMPGFMENYGATCNDHITIWCDMGSEINEAINDLITSGLTMEEDFVFLDVASYSMAQSMIHKVERRNHVHTGVNWLKARYADGAIYVWYVEGRQR
jgi:hypothetical protein